MRYLLDTCILLWAMDNSRELSNKFSNIIENDDNVIFISVVSYWEITIKKSLGKLEIPENWVDVIDDSGFTWLNIVPNHIHSLEKFPYKHHDPFDRLLISQALAENLKLLTVDKKILQYDRSLFC